MRLIWRLSFVTVCPVLLWGWREGERLARDLAVSGELSRQAESLRDRSLIEAVTRARAAMEMARRHDRGAPEAERLIRETLPQVRFPRPIATMDGVPLTLEVDADGRHLLMVDNRVNALVKPLQDGGSGLQLTDVWDARFVAGRDAVVVAALDGTVSRPWTAGRKTDIFLSAIAAS